MHVEIVEGAVGEEVTRWSVCTVLSRSDPVGPVGWSVGHWHWWGLRSLQPLLAALLPSVLFVNTTLEKHFTVYKLLRTETKSWKYFTSWNLGLVTGAWCGLKFCFSVGALAFASSLCPSPACNGLNGKVRASSH